MNVIRRLRNYSICEDWDPDKRRAYRQVNTFNLNMCILTLTAMPVALIFKVYTGFAIEVTCFLLYTAGFYLVSRKKLNPARKLAIHTFESNMFLVSFYAVYQTSLTYVPIFSPVFMTYIIYPLVAAIFDKPVMHHLGYAFSHLIGLQFIGLLLYRIGFPVFPEQYADLLTIIIFVYTLCTSTVLIFLLYTENRDVKELAVERSKQLEHLLSKVEYSNTRIQEQAAQLQKANDDKNRFFSIIAHDLKSPYSAVLGLSELLKKKSINDPEYYRYAKVIHDSATHTYNLLGNLLDWARAQLNQIRFEPETVMLHDAVTQSIDFIRVGAEKKGITVLNEIGASVMVRADTDLLGIILRNLIANAVKYTHHDGSVLVASRQTGDFEEVSVTDNGTGMPEELVRNLFHIEKKQSLPGTDAEQGTGLGLILCREFVGFHGGRIWVESEVNKGTVFYFTLPLVSPGKEQGPAGATLIPCNC